MPNPLRSLALLPLLSGFFSPVTASTPNLQVQEPNQAQTQAHGAILPASVTSDDAFPSCAVNCSLLQQAQTDCVPVSSSSAPDDDHDDRDDRDDRDDDYATITSCFCQSSLIDRLHSGPDGVCDHVCTASDRALLHAWYGRYCAGKKNIKREIDNTLEDTEMAPTQKISTLEARGGGDWWSTHYQWIIMVIVLIIGFTILTVLGVWLKRRHDAKYPHLYHGGSRDSSGLLLNRQQQFDPTLNQPGSFDPSLEMAQPRHFAGENTDSFASSSRTEVTNPRTPRTPSRTRLQRPMQSPRSSDFEIREASPR